MTLEDTIEQSEGIWNEIERVKDIMKHFLSSLRIFRLI